MPQLVKVGRLMNPGGKATWTPTQLGASLLAWWSADRVDLMTLSGSQVTTWRDIVAGYAPTQSVAGSKPLYSATSFNGSPGVTFDGIDDYLELASQPFPSGAVPSELWALIDQTALPADTGSRNIIAYGGTGNATTRMLYRFVNAGANQVAALTGDGVSFITTTLAGNNFSGRHVARSVISATATTVSLDGTAMAPAAVVPGTGTTRVRLGASVNASPSLFLQGVMRDAMVMGALSTDQAALLNTYLMYRRNP